MSDPKHLQGMVRKAVAVVISFLLALILLVALLITGFYLLVQALVLALSPWLGQAGAMGLAGLLCILLLIVFFQRLIHTGTASKKDETTDSSLSPIEALRQLIRENPLESALAAFAVGVAEQSDPRLRSLLLQGGMTLMKRGEPDSRSDVNPDNSDPAPPASDEFT